MYRKIFVLILFVTLSLSGVLGPSLSTEASTTTPAAQSQSESMPGMPPPGVIVPFDRAKAEQLRTELAPADVTGPQKIIVLRVYFNDYPASSTYSKAQVEGFYDNLDQLWQDTSYGKISLVYQVTDLFQLPDNRSLYVDDLSGGDLSNGGKFGKVLTDAIANSPGGLDWTDVDAVNVLMAETSTSQFHRGQGTTCNLPMGPGGPIASMGCAIFSENPGATQNETWGRFAHELGHTFQQAGPAHPSNYNNEFELMDHNYPGQTGVFEKQSHTGFPGWMPPAKYQVITPASGGDAANIWAMEYDPTGQPNIQAVKAEITGSLYYMISVRRRILGDELHAADSWHTHASPNGIPDEGVLIERVSEGSDPWVTVKGPGGDRNALWHEGDTYSDPADGIVISIAKKLDLDGDGYAIRVAYDQEFSFQPDVMLEPWTSPPGNTWETTDIWVDSPVNGYGAYSNGMWNDIYGNLVPVGNGDNPAVGLVNRIYARVRNVGFSTATDVVVNWEITDPPGVGIAGASGWASLGSVDKIDFPALASISPGSFVDVYVEWTPSFAIPEGELDDGLFSFHTCLRVKLDAVAGETVLGNQDGDREQENISTFQAPESDGGAAISESFNLFNDDLVKPKFFFLNYESDLPKDWELQINGGVLGIQLDPGEMRTIPVSIKPGSADALGSVHGVDIKASSLQLLENDLVPSDLHPEFTPLGGVRFEARTLRPPKITCKFEETPNGLFIRCVFEVPDFEKFYDPENPFKILLVGVKKRRNALTDMTTLITVGPDGAAEGLLPPDENGEINEVTCLFAGTTELASASCGYLLVGTRDTFLPIVQR